MDKKDWQIIDTVYTEKNITRASLKLFMSQPTVTYRIKQIEKELDIEILHRGRHGVEFTEQGMYFAKYAKSMLKEYRSLEENLSNLSNEPQGLLRIGAARAIASHQLPKVLADFNKKYPAVSFDIETGLNLDIAQGVYKEDFHLGIIRGNHHWSDEKHELFKESITIISLKEIDLQTLAKQNRITYQTDPALNMHIDNWWRDNYKFPPKILMSVDNMEIAKKMVINGLGYAIVPKIILNDREDQQLKQFDLCDKNNEPLLWITSLLYKKDTLNLSFVRDFIKFIKEAAPPI